MFVRDRMSRDPVVVRAEDTLQRARLLMEERGFEALPVTENGRLAGIITHWDILRALGRAGDPGYPEGARVVDVMTREVQAVRPDDVIEEAAWYMSRYDYTALPVVEENGALVGIITAHDLFRALVDMLAITAPGTRVTLVVPDRVGVLARITEVVRDAGVSIASVAVFPRDVPGWAEVVLRLKTTQPKDCLDRLVAAGFNVTHVSLVWTGS